jgi:hypothetical protein
VRFSPLKPGARLSGGRPEPVKGAPYGRVAKAMAQAPPLTEPDRESPGPYCACRVEGGAGEAAPPRF